MAGQGLQAIHLAHDPRPDETLDVEDAADVFERSAAGAGSPLAYHFALKPRT
ncbi:hypothetical protein V473_00795 [Sphingobium cupriresistens LL01]|uniref:Uncharacterized protein n=1 Tax=Sphingobium cupriresistens LL01 TaxID=1420583 RepID=A0A0J8AWV7_9SPHN|nr:hypothetical protein V473_00795 [Sphingobium cupriresistens LL01]